MFHAIIKQIFFGGTYERTNEYPNIAATFRCFGMVFRLDGRGHKTQRADFFEDRLIAECKIDNSTFVDFPEFTGECFPVIPGAGSGDASNDAKFWNGGTAASNR
jgi:hypothetical protein